MLPNVGDKLIWSSLVTALLKISFQFRKFWNGRSTILSICYCSNTDSVLLCLWAEVLTKDVLKDLLARYGKEVDYNKEGMRLGVTHKESRLAIIKDYDLPITPEQFTEEIMPMYREKWVLIISFRVCLKTHNNEYWCFGICWIAYLLLPSRWLLAQALPGANRLIKHLHSKKVPFALASNSITKNVEAKVSHQPGLLFSHSFNFAGHVDSLHILCLFRSYWTSFYIF